MICTWKYRYAKHYLILFEYAAVIIRHKNKITLLKHKMLQVNYPFTLTDLQQNQQTLSYLQFNRSSPKSIGHESSTTQTRMYKIIWFCLNLHQLSFFMKNVLLLQ